MRRLLVLPLLLAAAVTGCSTEPDAPATTPSSAGTTPAGAAASSATGGPEVPATADKALSGNTKAICAQATRVSTQFALTFAQDVKLLVDASSDAEPAAVQKAKEKTSRDVENFSFALGDMGKLTDDAAVKKALLSMSKKVGALKGDVRKLDDKKLTEISSGLDDACGSA
jgi:hypothetical protein